MKKLLNLMMLVLLFTACSNDDDPVVKEIILDKTTPSSQTIYSDDNSAPKGISFTATENWTATVKEIKTRAASSVSWLELSRYNGGAGKYTLNITTEKNNTGADRKAEIKIASGGTAITVTVEQKAVTREEAEKEPGDKPDKPQATKKVKTIKLYMKADKDMTGVNDMYLSAQADLSYDDKGRVVKVDMTDNWFNALPNGGGQWEKDSENCSFTYKKQDNGNLMIEVRNTSTGSESQEKYIDIEYLYCDNAGKVVRAEAKSDDNLSDDRENYQYEYDNQNQLIKTVGEMTGYENRTFTTDFTWNNHNLFSYSSTDSEYGTGSITYTEIKNDANIDLASLVCFGNSTELLAFPYGVEKGSLSGYFGNRVACMPAAIQGSCGDSHKENFAFEYKHNAEGYINEVNITESIQSSDYVSNDSFKVVIEYTD